MILPFVEIKYSPDKLKRAKENSGRGIFATSHFESNQVILKFNNSKLVEKNQLLEYSKNLNMIEIINDYLQISEKLYLDLSGDITRFIQHSCNPNTTVKIVSRTPFLISNRSIKPNEELTFDFCTTSDEDIESWQMDCHCGSWNCRKKISGFNTLSEKEKEKVLNQSIIPKYIKK